MCAGRLRPAFFIALTRKENHPILTLPIRGLDSPHDVKAFVEKSLDADKALDIRAIPLDAQNALADYMVVASGTSSRHVGALAEKLKERLESRGFRDIRIEGLSNADWVVLDAGDVIVHIFRPEVRAFYNIEKMWGAPHTLHAVSAGSAYA